MSQRSDTSGNSAFSLQLPGLQLAVDSTSLGDFKRCPRYYYYSMVLGYKSREESVHLTFGILLHSGRERYDHGRASGLDHEAALDGVIDWALRATWNSQLQRPWSPEGKSSKNRYTLLRTLVWYLDEFGQNDPFETLILANGKPAVELSFQFQLELRTSSTDEPYMLCGHFDRIGLLNGAAYVLDIKSTEHTLSPSYFKRFSPDNQFSLYPFASKTVFQQPVHGIIVDAVQIAVGFSRFQRQPIARDEAQLDEWYGDTGYWLRQMEVCAEASYWPMNDKSCMMFGGCDYQGICSKSPASRQTWLEQGFKRRVWNPLVARGDI